MLYVYGMRLRGYSPGAQPRGVYDRRDDPMMRYHDIITYTRQLSAQDMVEFDLDYIGEEE